MLRYSWIGIVSFLGVLWGAGSAFGATAWDESGNGDLSNNRLAPTAITIGTGSNIVRGTTGNAGSGVDRDYFQFTIPAGATLTAINVMEGTSVSGGSSFIAIQAGPQITVTPSGAGVEQLLGFMHYGNDTIGQDILPQMAVGFSGALPAGTYSMWVQETGGPAAYAFDLVVSAPPGEGGGNVDVPTLPEWGAILLSALLLVSVVRQGGWRGPRRG